MLTSLPRPRLRMRDLAWVSLPVVLALVLAAVAVGLSAATIAAPAPGGPAAVSIATIGSPFSPNKDGLNDALLVDVTTAEPATLSVVVRDYDGKLIRTLATNASVPAGTRRWSWNGKDVKGRLVADGPYRIAVTGTSAGGAVSAERYAAKAPSVPYGTAPGEIVVALAAGHGIPDDGAVYRGVRERDLNLDIAKRLRVMLEASGVTVVMVRETDNAINIPETDVSGNGRIDHGDELVARNDVANLAAADVFITLMNNAYGCHCVQGTETYTSDKRTWTPEGTALARFIQKAHLARLKAFKTKVWKPTDRGVRYHDFYGVRPFNTKQMPRPSLMASVLVESLFMDQPPELATLVKRPVRTALAAAYFDGITRYLANRTYGLRYELLSAPGSLPAGQPADARVRITNRGNQASSGWSLQVRIVPSVPVLYARPQRGTLIATVPVPDGLAPGRSTELALDALPMPPKPGDWIVLLDVLPGGDRTLADQGVVQGQWRVTLTSPGDSPSPSPDPSVPASPGPSTAPSWAPGVAPSTAPSAPPPPSVAPGTAPSVAPSAPPPPAASPSPAGIIVPPDAGGNARPSDPPASDLPQPVRPARSMAPQAPAAEPSPQPSPAQSPTAEALAALAGRGGGGRVPVPTPGDGADMETRMRVWRRSLPADALAGRPGPGAAVRWSASAAFRRGTVPIDIPIESDAGMGGIFGHDHPH